MSDLELMKQMALEQLSLSEVLLQACEIVNAFGERVARLEGQLAVLEARDAARG